MKYLLILPLLLCQNVKAQSIIDTASFQSSAHHWYDIFDKSNVINPRANQARYKASDIEAIGNNILLYQKTNGGWPKNYDMMAILTNTQQDSLYRVKSTLNTTFDNATTYTHIVCLASIYTATKQQKFAKAAIDGLDYILSAQYGNGGWPQYYPLENNYSRCITFNDDVFSGIMWLLKDVVENKPEYAFVDASRRKKIAKAYEKALDCIIKTQINDAGKPTAWCQQYDERSLQPAWARAFEPPSICNNESAGLVLFLMSIEHPSQAIINAIENAVLWFKQSEILQTRVKTIEAPDTIYKFRRSHTDRIVVTDPKAPPIWTRYYELKTHRPLFCNRDSKVVYSLAEVDRERRDGYGWYTYEPAKVLKAYSKWAELWTSGKNVLATI